LDRTGGEPDQPARADAVGDCGERAPNHGETGLARTGSSLKGIRCGARKIVIYYVVYLEATE
jgi:hypothetical protein